MKDSLKVAGVTFANPDGTNRQNIIKAIGVGFKTAKLRQTVFNGERAVEVRIGGALVGYVSKTQLTNPMSFEKELTAFVDYSHSKYHIQLTMREKPSGAEYAAMKALCLKAGKPMPAYDHRAYMQYWAAAKA